MNNETPLKKFLEFYDSLKKEIYIDLESKGFDHISHVEGNSFLTAEYFTNLLRSKQNVRGLPYSDFQIYEELDGITQDLKYIIGIMTLMQPHLANLPLEQGVYSMKSEDQIYLRYATFAFQSVYNFWDRLGDLIYIYFETNLNPTSVYFGRVIDRIEDKYKTTEAYVELKNFYDRHLRIFLDERHQIVHHFQLKSKTRWEHIEHHPDMTKLKEDFAKTHGYLYTLKNQLHNCFQGYLLTLKFISALTDKVSNSTL